MTISANTMRNIATVRGDLSGSLLDASVVGLRNIGIADTNPTDGQVLKYNAADNKIEWQDESGGGGGGGSGDITSVLAGTNLTGGGLNGAVTLNLASNISLNSVSASFSGTFIGDGSGLTGVQQDLSSYATKTQVTGALAPYITSASVASVYATKDDLVANMVLYPQFAFLDSNYLTKTDAGLTYALTSSAITINGTSVALGSSINVGDITGVSAGTNLTGGGTSGAITLNLSDSPSVTEITAETGSITGDLTVNGNLYVNGTRTVVNTTDLTVTDNIILIASGATNSAQLDGAGIHFGRIPSEDARIIYDSVNDWMEVYPSLSSSVVRGTFIGDGSQLSGIQTSDPTTVSFVSSNVSLYDAVALNSTGLVKADKSDNTRSNVFGVVSAINGTNVTVKICGEVTVNGASSYTTSGSVMWLGSAGAVADYASIGSGNYASQVGFISGPGKVILLPRASYKLA